MGPEVVSRNRNCEFNGPYAGRDLYITMYQESEREFVVTHNANIKPVSYFTGRETELQDLRQRIEEGRKSVLVSGMGGIGKTHICRKLFEEYWKKHAKGENCPFRHIGYIEYSGDMGSSLQSCLKFRRQDSPEQNQEAAWRELEYLASDGKLLLFVDNVNTGIGADSGLQRLNGIPGAVILTSRQASFSDEFEPYRIGFLPVEQCKEIYEKIRFRGSAGKVRPEEMQDLEHIIENMVGRHTITVELLAHLANTKAWTVKRLREELEEKGFRLTFHKNGEFVDIQKSYEVLYDLSDLTEAEKNILEAFSIFPYIPLDAETCNEWLLEDAGVSEDEDVLMGLYQKGWLQFDAVQESYALHPVFAQFIYEKYRPGMEKHQGLMKIYQKCAEMAGSGSVPENLNFIPFAETMLEKINTNHEIEKAEYLNNLAAFLAFIAEYEKAEELHEKSLEIFLRELGENHPNVAVLYNNLASISMDQGNYKKAEEFWKRSLRILRDIVGEAHKETMISYNGLAGTYLALGKYEEAEELLKKGIGICETTLGREHYVTLAAYDTLANVYAEMGEYKKAEKVCKESTRIRESLLGEDHLDLAVSYNNLGIIYFRQGEFEKAKELFEKSLQIRENVFGEDHIKITPAYHNLAEVYWKLGESGKARKLIYKGLQIKKRTFGEKHPDMINDYNLLAMIYEREGEYTAALKYCFKAYKICMEQLGPDHIHTQDVYAGMRLLWYEGMLRGDFNRWLEEKMKE